jgi:hypothetical protein
MPVWRAVIGRILRRGPKKRKNVSRVISSLRRRVSRTNGMLNAIPQEPVHSTLEMDTHADTCVLGPNFVIMHYTSRECDVSPYTGKSNTIPREPVYSTLEMDTHADICVLGPSFVILHYTNRECDVSPYSEVYESVKADPIVSGATAWTDERTGLTYILVVNEALWMPDTVTSNLIKPNQLRAYGITVQDNPFAGPCTSAIREKSVRD